MTLSNIERKAYTKKTVNFTHILGQVHLEGVLDMWLLNPPWP